MLKRDVSGATLEDHFDKTILLKVMQVGKRELFLHSFTTLCWLWDRGHYLGSKAMPLRTLFHAQDCDFNRQHNSDLM